MLLELEILILMLKGKKNRISPSPRRGRKRNFAQKEISNQLKSPQMKRLQWKLMRTKFEVLSREKVTRRNNSGHDHKNRKKTTQQNKATRKQNKSRKQGETHSFICNKFSRR
jgi:hypothetical protein